MFDVNIQRAESEKIIHKMTPEINEMLRERSQIIPPFQKFTINM